MSTSHNISALLAFSAICFLSLIGVSTARPTVEPPSQLQSLPQPHQLQGVWTTHSHRQDARAAPLAVGASTLERRAQFDDDSRRIVMRYFNFQRLSLLYPVVSAAKFLEDFYIEIATKAETVWKTEPRDYVFRFQQGPFLFKIESMGETVSWHFVHEVADLCWECACRGMAELFEAFFMDDSRTIGAVVSLTMADNEGSSQYSSGTDWREGSVPSVGTHGE